MQLDFTRIPLVGRTEERRTLKRSLDETTGGTIWVEGAPGCGRTALVQKLYKDVLETKIRTTFICMGTHQESSAVGPFVALAEVLDQLVEQIQADENLENPVDWRKVINHEVNSREMKLLSTICPAIQKLEDKNARRRRARNSSIRLSAILEKDSNISAESFNSQINSDDASSTDNPSHLSEESKSQSHGMDWNFRQLRLALRSFVRVICKQRKLVMVFDDCHMADNEYWNVLETIMFDSKLENFWFIGTRLSGVETEFFKRVSTEQSASIVEVGSLRSQDISEIISSLTFHEAEDCLALAEAVLRRTDGNSILVMEFLRLLQRHSLLHFSSSSLSWEWDLDSIIAKTSVFEGLVDFTGIESKSHEMKVVLMAAASIGLSRFELRTLFFILRHTYFRENSCFQIEKIQQTVDSLAAVLNNAVKDGLVEKIGDNEFKFVHERLREAAERLVETVCDNPGAFHEGLGKALLAVKSGYSSDSQPYLGGADPLLLGCYHLNLGEKALTTDSERENLMYLNLRAATAAFSNMSLRQSKYFLQFGLNLAKNFDGWKVHYLVTLKMCTFMARVYFCMGELRLCCDAADDIVKHSRVIGDSVPAIRYKVMSLFQMGDDEASFTLCLQTLKRLGFFFPRNRFVAALMLLRKVIVFKISQRHLAANIDRMKHLSETQDERISDVMSIYSSLFEMGMAKADGLVQGLAAMNAWQITLEHGTCDYSFTGYFMSVVLISFGAPAFDALTDFAQAILKQSEASGSPYHGTVITGGTFFALHWKQSMQSSLDSLLVAKDLSLESGLTSHLFFACMAYSLIYIHSGLSLIPLSHDMMNVYETFHGLHSKVFLELLEPPLQFVKNLLGENTNPTDLSGEIISDQDQSLAQYLKNGNARAVYSFRFFRMVLAYLFNDIDLAHSLWTKMDLPYEATPQYLFETFIKGLVSVAFAKKFKTQRVKRVRKAKKFLRLLNSLAKRGAVNTLHYAKFLEAEIASLGSTPHGKVKKIQNMYDEAISIAARLGYLNVQAMACERAGEFFLRRKVTGDNEDLWWAREYLERARTFYGEWGAVAKVKHMEVQYAKILSDLSSSSSTSLGYHGSSSRARQRFGDLKHYRSSALSSSESFGRQSESSERAMRRQSASSIDFSPKVISEAIGRSRSSSLLATVGKRGSSSSMLPPTPDLAGGNKDEERAKHVVEKPDTTKPSTMKSGRRKGPPKLVEVLPMNADSEEWVPEQVEI